MKIKDCCKFEAKSKIKAGEACQEGKYVFFTSSQKTGKIDRYIFDGEYLIMGTGGSASLHYYSGKFATSTDCFILKPEPFVSVKYLFYVLKSKMDILEQGFKGAGLKHTNKDYVKAIEVGEFPSLEKQDKIVAKLDLITEMIECKENRIQLYNELVKSKFVEMFGDPVFNTKGYPELTLPELGEFGRGISKHRPRNDPALLGGNYPLIQTGDVANAGLYITKFNSTYSELGLKQSKIWDTGTLCITIAANIAKTAILSFDACFPDSIVGFKANEKTNNIFIHYWFSFLQKLIEEQAPETAQKNINLSTLNRLLVITPPLEEQKRFIEWVSNLQELLLVVDETKKYYSELLKVEMHKYFD